jgi:sialic acid synthase SpsE
MVARRSLPAGHVLAAEDLLMKSPGDGVPPTALDSIVGRRLLTALEPDEPISFEMLGLPTESVKV